MCAGVLPMIVMVQQLHLKLYLYDIKVSKMDTYKVSHCNNNSCITENARSTPGQLKSNNYKDIRTCQSCSISYPEEDSMQKYYIYDS